MEKDLKERFLKTYANIPLNLRDEIILVLDEKLKTTGTVVKESISWRVAYIEVQQNTELGKKILEQLTTLNLI